MQKHLKQRRITPTNPPTQEVVLGTEGVNILQQLLLSTYFASDLPRRCFPKTVSEIIPRNEGDGILCPEIMLSMTLDFCVFTSCLPMRRTE